MQETGEDGTSPLHQALARGLAPGGDLAAELGALGEYGIGRPDEARALADAIARWEASGPAPGPGLTLPLHLFTGLLQGVETREAFDVLRALALPPLLAGFDRALAGGPTAWSETLLFVLKVATMYRVEEAVGRVVAAARAPVAPGSPLWAVVFEAFDDEHPYRLQLANRLRGAVPAGAIGLHYLALSGALVSSGVLTAHPFDNAEGRERLRDWLQSADDAAAEDASANLPWLDEPARGPLLALARQHPSARVRLRAAWADARLGNAEALMALAAACLGPGTSATAAAFLTELGHGGMIPAAALTAEFQARAEMGSWLSHPSELGKAPERIELLDARAANWPPTNDLRPLWLFRFEDQAAGVTRKGQGMVGSITFSLRAETAGVESAEDLYALHCCWELEVNGDPRAPALRTAEAGRAILRAYGWSV